MLIVGLGNPGKKYENTRHNAGFMAIDEFARKNNFPEFRFSKKFNAQISENILEDKKIILVKPQTYMNESGKTVKRLIPNLKSQILNLIVIHDDIDLPLGEIKIVKNRGSAGHKGVESIINILGTEDFIRIRIGINNPKQSYGSDHRTEDVVLKKFGKNEENILKATIDKATDALKVLTKDGPEKAMNEYNK